MVLVSTEQLLVTHPTMKNKKDPAAHYRDILAYNDALTAVLDFANVCMLIFRSPHLPLPKQLRH